MPAFPLAHGVQAITITSAQRTTLGRVAVKGTVTCSKTTSGVGVGAYVRQVAGRTNTISGEGYGTIRCVAGTKVPFSVLVTPEYGKFVGGKALVQAGAYKEFYSYNEETDVYHYHWDGADTEREMNLTREDLRRRTLAGRLIAAPFLCLDHRRWYLQRVIGYCSRHGDRKPSRPPARINHWEESRGSARSGNEQ